MAEIVLLSNHSSEDVFDNHSHTISITDLNTKLKSCGLTSNDVITKVELKVKVKFQHETLAGIGMRMFYSSRFCNDNVASGTDITSETQMTDGSYKTYDKDITSYVNTKHPFNIQNTSYSNLCYIYMRTDNLFRRSYYCEYAKLVITYETIPTRTVTWENYDGTVLETDTGVPVGTTPTYNGATPTRKGYTFSGWNPAVGAITWDTRYRAQFTENKYKIAFNGNGNTGGSMSPMTNIGYDDKATLTANAFTKTGHTFAGWATSANGSVTYHDQHDVVMLTPTNGATVTLYAVWKVNNYTILIDFEHEQCDLETEEMIVFSSLQMVRQYGYKFTLKILPAEGYKFVKWSDGNTDNPRSCTVTGDKTYIAICERIAVPIKVNGKQVIGCYIVPSTKTVIFDVGTTPTVDAIPENSYPLKKIHINGNRTY